MKTELCPDPKRSEEEKAGLAQTERPEKWDRFPDTRGSVHSWITCVGHRGSAEPSHVRVSQLRPDPTVQTKPLSLF